MIYFSIFNSLVFHLKTRMYLRAVVMRFMLLVSKLIVITINNLLLNTSKSVLMNIPTGYQFPNVSIIIPSDNITYLGIIFYRHLTCRSHIVELYLKSNYDLYNIHRTRQFISKYITLMLITSLVMSRFDYC